jgi:hypothetical protein
VEEVEVRAGSVPNLRTAAARAELIFHHCSPHASSQRRMRYELHLGVRVIDPACARVYCEADGYAQNTVPERK